MNRSTATLVLMAGDVLVIGLFVLLGEIRHYPVAVAMARTPGTLIPFIAGWLVTAWAAGLYGAVSREAGAVVAMRTGLAWVGATAIAMALRATPVFHGGADATFAVVAVGVGMVLLLPWRVVAAMRMP